MATLSERTSRRVFTGLVLLAIVLVAAVVRPFLEALFLAAVLAGLLTPIQARLSRAFRGRRNLAAAVQVLLVVLIIAVPVTGIGAFLIREAAQGYRFVAQAVRSEGMAGLVARLPEPLEGWAREGLDRLSEGEGLVERSLSASAAQGGAAAKVVTSTLVATGTLLLHAALMMVALFLLLVDGGRLVDWLEKIAPLKPGQTVELLTEFRRVASAVMFSSVATAGLQAVVALAGYFIARVPHAFFFGTITFFVALIPAIGAAAVCLVAALLLLVTGHPYAALFLAIWGVTVVGLADNVVKPILARRGMALHGGVIFFALLGGLAAFGPLGLLVGPMAVAFFLALVRIHERDYANKLPPESPEELADVRVPAAPTASPGT